MSFCPLSITFKASLCKTTGLTHESYSKNLLFLSKRHHCPTQPRYIYTTVPIPYMKTPFNCEFTPPNHSSLGVLYPSSTTFKPSFYPRYFEIIYLSLLNLPRNNQNEDVAHRLKTELNPTYLSLFKR